MLVFTGSSRSNNINNNKKAPCTFPHCLLKIFFDTRVRGVITAVVHCNAPTANLPPPPPTAQNVYIQLRVAAGGGGATGVSSEAPKMEPEPALGTAMKIHPFSKLLNFIGLALW